MNRKRLIWYMAGVLIILGVVALDQISKELAIAHLEQYEPTEVIPGLISFNRVTPNTGMGWGLLKEHRWVFMSVSAVAIVGFSVVYFAVKQQHLLFRLSAGFVIGGGIGNMIDRIFRVDGGVIDFIEFDFIDFPVFNVADSFITVGTVMLLVYFFFLDHKQQHPLLFDEKKTEDKADE